MSDAPTTELERLRLERGYSRAMVAAAFDMSERHLYRLEKGLQRISRMQAVAFATYYETTPDAVLNGAAA